MIILAIVSGLIIIQALKYLPTRASNDAVHQDSQLSSHRIDKVEVYKSAHKLRVMERDQIIKIYPIRLGFSPISHKEMEGDDKTPEGLYILDWRNPNSQFYKSIHVSYPNKQDIKQAKKKTSVLVEPS